MLGALVFGVLATVRGEQREGPLTMNQVLKRIGWAAGGLAVASATVIGTAGSAAADASLTIEGSPMPIQVGGSYQVVEDVASTSGQTMIITGSSNMSDGRDIFLYDNGQCVVYDWMGSGGTTLKGLSWTPMTAGTHTLQVREGWWQKTLTVTVAPAPPGSPAPTPQSGCGANSDTGSFGS